MLEELENRLKELGKVAVAFSGGIDSSFLLFVANKTLPKENVLAIIANGQMVPRNDYAEAIEYLKENNFNYIAVEHDALETPEFKENHKDRCYYCKKTIMTKVIKIANEHGFTNVLDGNNVDDVKVYRPGGKATKELGIISPLEECHFGKKEIRKYSKELGIKFWDKPSNSCLATRFPYNTILTNEDLEKVDKAEALIKELGIPNTRFRVHGQIARIEVDKQYFEKIINNEKLIEQLKELGFKYITLDLSGLTSGTFDK